jgi:hypothetical protein
MGDESRWGTTMMKKTALLALFLITVSYPAMARHRHAERGSTPGEQSHITCDMVRAYVAQVGLAQAKAMAETAGATEADKRRAVQCLEKKV